MNAIKFYAELKKRNGYSKLLDKYMKNNKYLSERQARICLEKQMEEFRNEKNN